MKKTLSIAAVHPMVIFWLGLLTGAVVVSLIFLYRILVPSDFESSILRNQKMPNNLNNNQSLQQLIVPQTSPSQTPSINEKSFPTPVPY